MGKHAVFKSLLFYNLLKTFRTIKAYCRPLSSDAADVCKAIGTSPLVILIIIAMSSFQACQPTLNREAHATMNQSNTGPPLPPDVELIRDPSNGTIRLLKGTGLTRPLMADEAFRKASENGLPGETAIAFISAYRRFFELSDPIHELSVRNVETDDLGMTHVRLKQQYKGLAVWPADINVHFNTSGDIYLVQGRYARTPSDVDVSARLNESDVLDVVSKDAGCGKDEWRDFRTQLIVYCGLSEPPALAFQTYAEKRIDKAWNYVVDAQTGAILAKTTAIQTIDGGRSPSAGKINLK